MRYVTLSDVGLVREGVTWTDDAGRRRGYGREQLLGEEVITIHEHGGVSRHWPVLGPEHRESAILVIAAGGWPELLDHREAHDLEAVIRAVSESIRQQRRRSEAQLAEKVKLCSLLRGVDAIGPDGFKNEALAAFTRQFPRVIVASGHDTPRANEAE
jgi:hypothetical protein